MSPSFNALPTEVNPIAMTFPSSVIASGASFAKTGTTMGQLKAIVNVIVQTTLIRRITQPAMS